MLNEYQRKRDFTKTKEPAPVPKAGEGDLLFVVQKHSARRLHYDFRLELDGVMKSWAIPNGPSLDPKVKRLAVMVEDHPLDYRTFEGSIPQGEYGAGQVIVWDQGAYQPEAEGGQPLTGRDQAQEVMRKGLEKGKLSFTLRGQKMRGSWALVKMQHTQKDWLLIKHHDEFSSPEKDILKEEASVFSGLTIKDLKENKKSKSQDMEKITGARKADFPSALSPMLASLASAPFSGLEWIFEPKLDGYRVVSRIQNGKASLSSRNGVDVSRQYPSLAADLSRQPGEMALDGEVVALDETGRPCFQCLQNHLGGKPVVDSSGQPYRPPVIYYVFDILYLNGYDLRSVPLSERKKLLASALVPSASVKPVDYYEDDGQMLYETSISYGLEGIIAKRKDSLYEAGKRSRYWLKIKAVQSDEFVIGGYTKGEGNRSTAFGALLLGSYDEQGNLQFAGHVGSGFDDNLIKELKSRLDSLKSGTSPFAGPVPLNNQATWLRPELVAEVKFSERTQEGYLRTPVFMRLREDKPSTEVSATSQVNTDSHTYQSIEKRSTDTPLHPGYTLTLSLPSRERNGREGENRDDLQNVIDRLKTPRENFTLEVEGRKIGLTHLDKALWPPFNGHAAFTKRDLLVYLAEVSPYLLPHLFDRAITLSRYPGGIGGEQFYQKHWSSPLPEFVETARLSEHNTGEQEYLLCNNLATLLWLGQQANIDIHSWFSRVNAEPGLPESSGEDGPDFFSRFPDFIVFDMDPYVYSGREAQGSEPELNRQGFALTCEAAFWLKEALDNLKLNSYIKTSGRTGLHIYVPIQRQVDFHAVHAAAKTISEFVRQKHPEQITLEWPVAKRTGKIFLDYNQNIRGKTLASVYSPRPSPEAAVSTPLRWEEVGRAYPTDFTIETLPRRLETAGDLWADILEKRADINGLLHM